jgi:general secretion pathway protein A
MYLNFYNLKKEPFQITPDPEFLFLSPGHKEALASIIYGIDHRKGFIAIIGEVGVGKTSVLRSYLEQADKENLKTIYIFNPNISFRGLLKTIFEELGLESVTEDPAEMLTRLYHKLIDEYKHKRNVALIIDEAQNMPVETLENMRMLSNLETSKDKLFQIVLVGQPEFEEMLNSKELRQLKQRIAIKTTISPLRKDECIAYIQHRLTKASLHGSTVFTQSALKKIISQSHGIPRIINVLCDNALITGFGYQKHSITARIAKEVIADFKGKKASVSLKWAFVAMALFLLIGAFSIYPHGLKVLSNPGVIYKFSKQENNISHDAENTVGPQTFRVGATKMQNELLVKKENTENKKGPVPIVRSVRKGDKLMNLVNEIYGRKDKDLIKLVMQNNPEITSSDKIVIGDEIMFPACKTSREDR